MAKEMLINTIEGQECRISVVDDGRLEELYIEAGTCVTQWEGERLDYGLATELLWDREFPED